MRKTILSAVLSLAVGAPTFALAQDTGTGGAGQGHQGHDMTQAKDQAKASGGAGQAGGQVAMTANAGDLPPLPKDAKGLAERLHADNLAEIQLAQMAQQKATTQSVKDYATMLLQHHTQMDQELTQLAEAQKMKLGAPKPVNDAEKNHLAAMKSKTAELKAMAGGKAWERVYLTSQVGSHDMAAGLLIGGQGLIADKPEMAQMVQKNLPLIMQHREQAHQLLGQLKPTQAAMGGAGMEGMDPSGLQQPADATEQPAPTPDEQK
jgi:putative membrane protein